MECKATHPRAVHRLANFDYTIQRGCLQAGSRVGYGRAQRVHRSRLRRNEVGHGSRGAWPVTKERNFKVRACTPRLLYA